MAFCLAFVLSQIKSIVSAKHCLNESVLRKFWKGLLCHYSLCAYGSLFKCFSELKTTFLGSLVRYIHAEKHTETEVRLSTALDHSQVLSHTPSWLFFGSSDQIPGLAEICIGWRESTPTDSPLMTFTVVPDCTKIFFQKIYLTFKETKLSCKQVSNALRNHDLGV